MSIPTARINASALTGAEKGRLLLACTNNVGLVQILNDLPDPFDIDTLRGLIAPSTVPAPDSPRYPNSVFIFGDFASGSFEPVGSCFAVSERHLLTAQHNMHNRRATNYGIAMTVSRSKGGQVMTDPILPYRVRVLYYNASMDYAILILEDASLPPLEKVPVSIARVEFDTDLKVFHCPVGLFTSESSDSVSVFTGWVKTSRCTAHHIPCSGGLFAGSSGSPFITRAGYVVGMHVESINEQIDNLNVKGLDVTDALEIVSDTVNSNAQNHASLSSALCVGLCPQLVKCLRTLGIQLHN
jgi:hypothetical protein